MSRFRFVSAGESHGPQLTVIVTGMPAGVRLDRERIPLAARVVRIADCWAAMTSPESYMPSVDRNEAMHRLRKDAGAQFDPSLVGTFVAAVDEIVG